MALKAGRVGVNKNQVDEFGNIIGGGTPENVYTKSQCDNKFETKAHIGGLQFRDNNGAGQYKVPNGEWTPISGGGGAVNYVTDVETVIGTYNNQPLYQRIIEMEVSSSSTSIITDVEFPTLDKAIFLHATINGSDTNTMIDSNFYFDSQEYFRCLIYQKKLAFNIGIRPQRPFRAVVFVQYTKVSS